MKYYSEVTKKLYDTEKELASAEAAVIKAQADEEEKKKARTTRAKEVEDACRDALNARQHYAELKNKFIKDYGSFHMSIKDETPVEDWDSVNKLIDLFFNL